MFDIVDGRGEVIGQAPRNRCHGDPSLVHRAVHVVVFHPDTGHILLQKRSCAKDIQPGKWDTAVGGHLDSGEDYLTAARREMREELGVDDARIPLLHLFDFTIRNAIESEDIRVFAAWHAGPFDFSREEIDEVRFWTPQELHDHLDAPDCFTPNLQAEIRTLLGHPFESHLPVNLA